MPKIKRTIISVSDKTGVVKFAGELNKLGVEILSTGGTAKALRDNKIPVKDVSDYTGSPEILDGRLKTLHPKIHGGLLGIRENQKHKKEMADNGILPIDMVVVNLYPFEATVTKEGCTLEDAVENIDIGGPTMLRAAAKNWRDVAVVVDSADYGRIAEELKRGNGEISRETCFELAQKVFAVTARYEAAICNYLNSVSPPLCTRPPVVWRKGGIEGGVELLHFPNELALTFKKVQDLRYGENPHQQAAFYKDISLFLPPVKGRGPNGAFRPCLPAVCLEGGGGPGRGSACIASARQRSGKELSYNNIMDADAALELVKEFRDKIAAVIIKHTNPCGAAWSDKTLAEAFVTARDCDPVSAFGGIVALTRPVDAETAKAIGGTFFEVIIAPGFNADALEILRAKKNLRLLEVPPFPPLLKGGEGGFHLRKVTGGLLVQTPDTVSTDIRSCKVATKRKPTDDEYTALDFAWRVVKHVKSNAIVISTCESRVTPASSPEAGQASHPGLLAGGGAGESRILGVGAGQTSRVDSVKIAIMKHEAGSKRHDNSPNPPLPFDLAQGRVKGGKGGFEVRVLASDAFFPFRDGVDLSAKAGVTAVIQPGGSIRDEDVIKAADENDIAMIFTGIRHFRH